MTIFTEGNLEITVPAGISARKFDDPAHGLSHCMKAVDFIIELEDRYVFVEVKDPQYPQSKKVESEKWVKDFLSGRIDEDLKYKYRDSFLYTWASAQDEKPIYYYVLVAIETLTEADLIVRTDDLKRKLPLYGPPSGIWKRKIVSDCAV